LIFAKARDAPLIGIVGGEPRVVVEVEDIVGEELLAHAASEPVLPGWEEPEALLVCRAIARVAILRAGDRHRSSPAARGVLACPGHRDCTMECGAAIAACKGS
jgi:hypothetical protein